MQIFHMAPHSELAMVSWSSDQAWWPGKPNLPVVPSSTRINYAHDRPMCILQVGLGSAVNWFGVPLQAPPANNFIRLKTWWCNMFQVGAIGVLR
jgi:hypothetical protein